MNGSIIKNKLIFRKSKWKQTPQTNRRPTKIPPNRRRSKTKRKPNKRSKKHNNGRSRTKTRNMAIKEKRPNGDTGARKELPQPIQTEISGEIAGEKGTSW